MYLLLRRLILILVIIIIIFIVIFVIPLCKVFTITHATNHISRVCSVAADLYLQFILYFTCQTCFALSHYYFAKYMCSAQYGCFRSSLILCFPGMLLRYCLNGFEMFPVVPIKTN